MTNKIKDIARRGISLILALGMMIPNGVYAEADKISNWNEYRERLKTAIINQDTDVTINFDDVMDFYDKSIIEDAINNTVKKAIEEVPKHLGELNINPDKVGMGIYPDAGRIEGVNHTIFYYNDFKIINTKLFPLYETIKTETNDVDKIKRAFNYVIDNLNYSSGSTNHDILNCLDDKETVSAQAYAMLFANIMDNIGYENIIISGTIKATPMEHHWNLVKVQGTWYHVDTRIADVYQKPADKEIYFLATDKAMKESSFLYNWNEAGVKLQTSEEESKRAIELVNIADQIIGKISDEESLSNIIVNAEAALKVAETEVKKISDTNIRTVQQNRIKDIKLVLAAMKAVDKAENTLPQKMTYVTSATSAINKIISIEYNAVKEVLLNRINEVKKSILASELLAKAEKAVVKAEKSLKEADIAAAITAVLSLDDSEAKKSLNLRNTVSGKMLEIEKSLTKYLEKPLEVNKTDLEGLILDIQIDLDSYTDGLNVIKTERQKRLDVIKSAIIAIEEVEKVKTTGDSELAEEAISFVTDTKIKKVLESRLKSILSQKQSEDNLAFAKEMVEAAENNIVNNGYDEKFTTEVIAQNQEAVGIAIEAVKKLSSGAEKTSLQARINDMNNAIKAKQILRNAFDKVDNSSLTEKDVIAAEKAVGIIGNKLYKDYILEKAVELRGAFDDLQLEHAYKAIEKAEISAKFNSTSLSKDISSAKSTLEAIKNKIKFDEEIEDIRARINALDSYMAATKVLVNAEKYMTFENKLQAEKALQSFKALVEKINDDKNIYQDLIKAIEDRIKEIGAFLTGETEKNNAAQKAIEEAEAKMTINDSPENILIVKAQDAVNLVDDKTKKAEFQKRIDAIKIGITAKTAVEMAEAFTDSTSVSAADKAVASLAKTGLYLDIVSNLNSRIGKLKNQLSIKKLVEDATKLVQKAVESRKITDITNARVAVKTLSGLEDDAYKSLTTILDELTASIGNEADEEAKSLELAQKEIDNAVKEISGVNLDIGIIIDPLNQSADIQAAYVRVLKAKNHIITASAAVRKLSGQKSLLDQINSINKEIDLAEDNIDVKEAVRLVTIASANVIKANNEETRALAKLDISAARRAIDKIGHSNNKALKTTITNTINSIEAKLTSNNDQKLIDAAVEAVNIAASMLTDAVKGNVIMDLKIQENIDIAIFSAELAIGQISDSNKAAKETLTRFINEIAAAFEAEKEGIKNEERMKIAEKAVEEAEGKKGTDELESYIRTARLKVNMIRSDGPDSLVAKAKIEELNARLDILEGKTPGSGGGSGSGSGNTGGGGKPDGSDAGGTYFPIDPLPDSKREIGVAEPNWGDIKKLTSTTPLTGGSSAQDMNLYRIYDSKLKILELSNILNITNNPKATLVIRGKNIKIDSKPYIQDKLSNSILVPIKTIGDELGFSVSLTNGNVANGPGRLLVNSMVDGSPKSLILDIGSEYGYVNRLMYKLSSKPLIQDGRTYIPLDFIVEHLGVTISYFKDNGNVQLIIN